ncbi:MAG: protein-methionine-sulfoxide reductase catalytic subunit MsrP [Methylococcaceae bacterium]|jgi:sulfoxide reductase catalytic subunit YedY
MKTYPQKSVPTSEITDPTVFSQRRSLIKAFLLGAVSSQSLLASAGQPINPLAVATTGTQLDWTPTPLALIQNYTNYYEFAFSKEGATNTAQALTIDPWSVEVCGEVEKPGRINLEDILHQFTLEERIYRFRCVEAWSMVVPWLGFPLNQLLARFKPLSGAKFVKFTSISAPEAMPNQARQAMLEWPYSEGLRIDEAMHPLTLLATGMYGNPLAKQNGAPIRLVVPWKYGFKSIKAVVKIELLKTAPMTTWKKAAPEEYGFYANVNPSVPHPRWSQFSERLLGSAFFSPRRKTELYNGYAEQVAALYADMDLRHFF